MRADNAVEPTRSENTTVTWRRSAVSCGATGEMPSLASLGVTVSSPFNSVIARNKFIDAVRRRGYRADIPIETVIETLTAEDRDEELDGRGLDRLMERLSGRQRDIVRSISMEGASARQTAQRLNMSEGAVRVALHRALKTLAALYSSDTPRDQTSDNTAILRSGVVATIRPKKPGREIWLSALQS